MPLRYLTHETMHDPIKELRRYAAQLETAVPVERARARAAAALAASPRRSRRTAVVAGAAVAFMGVSNVAMAAVADPAVPGDGLYGLDRAYERVASALGIGGDHRIERIEEAAAVIDRGDGGTALDLVMEALEGLVDDDGDTARAIIMGLENGADVDELAAQIQIMIDIARESAEDARNQGLVDAANDLAGSGLDVADIARRIRESVDLPDQVPQEEPGGAAGDNPADPNTPGPNENANENATDNPSDDAPAADPGDNSENGNSGGNSGKGDDTGSPPTEDDTDPPPGPPEDPGPPASSPSDTRPPKGGGDQGNGTGNDG